jgi:hypothetical protein
MSEAKSTSSTKSKPAPKAAKPAAKATAKPAAKKTAPVIAPPAKPAREKKPKAPSMSRTARAQAVADLHNADGGWELVSIEPVYDRFQCVCGGWGRKGFILQPAGLKDRNPKGGDEKSYTGAEWIDLASKTAGIVKVGASCLYHFLDKDGNQIAV